MAKVVCPYCGGLRYKEVFAEGAINGSALCPRCGGTGEVEENVAELHVLKFPAVNPMVKKREVSIATLDELAQLVSYLDMKKAAALTPIYNEKKEKLSAAIWEGLEGGYSIEIRVIKES